MCLTNEYEVGGKFGGQDAVAFEWKRLNWGWYYPDSGQFVDFKVTIDVEGERCSPQLFGFDNDRRNISQVSMLGILVFPLIRLDALYNRIPALGNRQIQRVEL
jgi:hypothetical protein